MDEFDDISEEELRLAAELAESLEAGADGPELPEELRGPVFLLKAADKFEIAEETLVRGRAEIERLAEASTGRKAADGAQTKGRLAWLYWLPLPAVLVLSLVIGLNQRSKETEGATAFEVPSSAAPAAVGAAEFADEEEGFEQVEARYHVGQTPRKLLEAQAAVLAQKAPGQEEELARAELDRQMRAYRGQLIASLELGGR